MSCQEAQTRADLVDTLFHTREESEANMERLNTSTSQIKNKQHESAIHSHRAGKSIQTLDSRTSERSQTSNYGQQTSSSSRNTGIKVQLHMKLPQAKKKINFTVLSFYPLQKQQITMKLIKHLSVL